MPHSLGHGGGRWNPPGPHATLYFNGDPVTARLQIERLLEGSPVHLDDLDDAAYVMIAATLPRTQKCADATTPAGLRALGLPRTYPRGTGGRPVDGGQVGLRDSGLLESALARPRHAWAYEADADLATLAAEYGFRLAKDHPFVDGNKRLAFVATNVFLILNGFEIEATEPEVVDTMLRVAASKMSRAKFGAWIRSVVVQCAE